MRKGLWELSVPSLQLFCEYKTILKVKVYLKTWPKVSQSGDGDTEIWNQCSRALGPQLLLHWFDTSGSQSRLHTGGTSAWVPLPPPRDSDRTVCRKSWALAGGIQSPQVTLMCVQFENHSSRLSCPNVSPAERWEPLFLYVASLGLWLRSHSW